jgi:hypothetical protein
MGVYPLPETIVAGVTTGHPAHSAELNRYFNKGGVPIRSKGAVGNSDHNNGGGTDDTTAIEAAVADAHTYNTGAIIVEPGTYRISRQIVMVTGAQQGCGIIGRGYRNNGTTPYPTFVWDSPDPAPASMFRFQRNQQNIGNCPIEGVRFCPRDTAGLSAISYGPDPATPTASAKLDMGTYIRRCWFGSCATDVIRIESNGMTNYTIADSCRWDGFKGYAVYAKCSSRSIFSIAGNITADNNNTGGLCKGFLHIDMTDLDVNGYVHCNLSDINLEMNNDLAEVEAGGANPADRRGWVHASVSTVSTQRAQLFLTGMNVKLDSLVSGRASCSFLLMRNSTLAARTARVGTGILGIGGFNGRGTAATGDMIPIGNITDADKPSAAYASAAFYYNGLFYGKGGDTLPAAHTTRHFVSTAAN